jgi:cytochrome c
MKMKQIRFVGGSILACTLGLIVSTGFSKPATALDGDRGKEIFEKRCTGCHSLNIDKEGPRLGGVYGRAAGSVSTFTYSDAVKSSRVTWDAASLDKWLTDPDALIPDGNMAFRLVNADERAAVIDYLKRISNK